MMLGLFFWLVAEGWNWREPGT